MDDVKALFGLIDKKNKRRLLGAVICCVLSVLCGILPYLGVWGIVTCFLNERTENLFQRNSYRSAHGRTEGHFPFSAKFCLLSDRKKKSRSRCRLSGESR